MIAIAIEIDPVERSGQSVIVSSRLATRDPINSAFRTKIQRWVKAGSQGLALLSVERISGRRIRVSNSRRTSIGLERLRGGLCKQDHGPHQASPTARTLFVYKRLENERLWRSWTSFDA